MQRNLRKKNIQKLLTISFVGGSSANPWNFCIAATIVGDVDFGRFITPGIGGGGGGGGCGGFITV